MGARDDAADGVVLVREAAERRAGCRAPRDVRHAVHHVVRVLRHEAVRVRDRREQSVPAAVAEAERAARGFRAPRHADGDDAPAEAASMKV